MYHVYGISMVVTLCFGLSFLYVGIWNLDVDEAWKLIASSIPLLLISRNFAANLEDKR